MNKKLTIVDIAKLSGVGKSTVSRVLTNDPKVRVETRARVERIIAKHGYVPSKSAQSMRGGSQKVIGVIISRLDSASENKVVSSILRELYSLGYDAVIMESRFDTDKTNEHLDVLQKRNVDGVIVFGFTDIDMKVLAQWQERAIVIAMDTDQISSINYDNHGVIIGALDHLTDLGVQNISYIGVDRSDKTTGEIRLQAYLSWCEKLGVTPVYKTGELSYESAYQLVDSVLASNTEAIVCASDSLALGVIKRLNELGREDIAVTGVGGNELLSFLFPKTYSIDPGYSSAGEKAVKVLISNLKAKSEPVHITQLPVMD
ncbi:trehalose operon repressor TreR [Vibrio marisflavi]|uniref:HTH-type transcriptional regulator TreR n=1 Tax=Vibrio marisflavi CECT 7928 TaxID=634439 RepID=A0ABM9A437_9VIBR|nr:trehalose operon repressor TreR [Vibrio marisflavi]CAH0538946.1 HTH-type transcriptional regulator TreR [Vibrio marisflavi CECT 7928]